MDDLEVTRLAARAGAEIVAGSGGAGGRVDFKGAVDPVTEVDRQAEQAILDVIHAHRPGDGVLTEEREEELGSGGRRWIVDPLDGTVNFVHGVPHVAVSVALFDGEGPASGVVIDVFRGEEFTAARGAGTALDGRPVRVTERAELSEALIATGFPYDRRLHAAEYARTVGRVLEEARGIRRMGTAALDLAWVAAGRYDGFWEFSLSPWDVAAGLLLIREAGGTATDERGEPARPGDPVLVASNGRVHDDLRRLVAASLPAHVRRAGSQA